jgi:hypothetical protein
MPPHAISGTHPPDNEIERIVHRHLVQSRIEDVGPPTTALAKHVAAEQRAGPVVIVGDLPDPIGGPGRHHLPDQGRKILIRKFRQLQRCHAA